ncbi:hypothetical protein Dxin01_03768 [Deinococcus xinjiangensis]|uniref:Uncharacterized protein n=1 Tax=Deinococcus xinjiangensis TaxID=457454 RepID=A0ABP9VFJ7_9DEIO
MEKIQGEINEYIQILALSTQKRKLPYLYLISALGVVAAVML